MQTKPSVGTDGLKYYICRYNLKIPGNPYLMMWAKYIYLTVKELLL